MTLPPVTKASKPARTLVLPPSTFADEWTLRPKHDILVGLRRISETDEQNARAIAARKVVSLYTEPDSAKLIDEASANDAYNDTLFAYAVARAICDPNDVAKTHPSFPLAEDQVPTYFTSEGIRFVWDAIVRMRLETSPTQQQASDADVDAMCVRIELGDLKLADAHVQTRARKLLSAVIELLGPQA